MKFKCTKEELIVIVNNSLSKAEVLRQLGMQLAGGNYTTLSHKIKQWNIETSHFTGAAWNQGERFKTFNKITPLEELLVENSTVANSNGLKKRLYVAGLKEPKCEGCGLTDWRGQPLTLDLEHKNGDHFDNRLENLEILCPNCHRQTKTWGNNKR